MTPSCYVLTSLYIAQLCLQSLEPHFWLLNGRRQLHQLLVKLHRNKFRSKILMAAPGLMFSCSAMRVIRMRNSRSMTKRTHSIVSRVHQSSWDSIEKHIQKVPCLSERSALLLFSIAKLELSAQSAILCAWIDAQLDFVVYWQTKHFRPRSLARYRKTQGLAIRELVEIIAAWHIILVQAAVLKMMIFFSPDWSAITNVQTVMSIDGWT